jgi:hypothetical protein
VAERAARLDRRRRATLERLAEQARIVALRAQVNPHFFFNALNTIAALIPTRPADAERAVELLAEALRPVLMRDQPMTHPLRTEFAVAEAYAQIERLRFGDRLRIEFDLPAGLATLPVPSLSLQPLLENAIRHGAGRLRRAVERARRRGVPLRPHARGTRGAPPRGRVLPRQPPGHREHRCRAVCRTGGGRRAAAASRPRPVGNGLAPPRAAPAQVAGDVMGGW